jgi:hypothetical protein
VACPLFIVAENVLSIENNICHRHKALALLETRISMCAKNRQGNYLCGPAVREKHSAIKRWENETFKTIRKGPFANFTLQMVLWTCCYPWLGTIGIWSLLAEKTHQKQGFFQK